jgi:hypothetical protein
MMKLQDVTLKAMEKMLTWVEATEIAGMPKWGSRLAAYSKSWIADVAFPVAR